MGRSATRPTPLVDSTTAEKSQDSLSSYPMTSLTLTVERVERGDHQFLQLVGAVAFHVGDGDFPRVLVLRVLDAEVGVEARPGSVPSARY